MSKEQAVIHYVSAVSVFEKWLQQGIISQHDFLEIAAVTADRYGLPKRSIYRRNDLIINDS